MRTLTLKTAIRGMIIIDKMSYKKYLIFYHDRETRSLHCLSEDFDVVSLGTDWIDCYWIKEKIDIDRLLTNMNGIG